MTAQCPCCDRPQLDGILCSACCDVLERELGDVAAIVADLDITLSKQARIGSGGAPGLARERTPIAVGAMDPIWVLGNVLTTWARDVCGESAAWLPRADSPAKASARALLASVPAIRRHPAVVELVDEVLDSIRHARRTVDRPADRMYLGQCLMENPDENGAPVTCLAELWARRTASEVQCGVCGTEHPVAERRAWLLKKCEDYLFTVKDASQMMGEVGRIVVTQASIRGYIHRGKIAYRSGNLIRLGDLLAVVVDEGERRTA